MSVMLPWSDPDEVFGSAVTGLDVLGFDGVEAVRAHQLRAVEFYILPYLGGVRPLELMTSMPALRAVQSLSAGVDDVWPHLPVGVTLHNAAGVHDASTAELAIGLILASLRGIDEFARAMPAGVWLQGDRPALADKSVLIVGYGRIGAAIERRLAGFEVTVTRVARTNRTAVAPDGTTVEVHSVAELPQLLPSADVVVLVCPLTSESRGMVDAEFLARMRDDALLVNVGRGPLVVTDDLMAQLRRGRLRAALDVTDPEPLPADHPLWRLPRVLISPHGGGDTSAFLPRAEALVEDQLRRWRSGEELANRMVRP